MFHEVDTCRCVLAQHDRTAVDSLQSPELDEAVPEAVVTEMRQYSDARTGSCSCNGAIGGVPAMSSQVPAVGLLIELDHRLTEAEQFRGGCRHCHHLCPNAVRSLPVCIVLTETPLVYCIASVCIITDAMSELRHSTAHRSAHATGVSSSLLRHITSSVLMVVALLLFACSNSDTEDDSRHHGQSFCALGNRHGALSRQ